MKKLLAALLALLCLPGMTALGDTQGDFTYALTPEGAVVTVYYVEDAAQTPAVITVPDALGGQPVVGIGEMRLTIRRVRLMEGWWRRSSCLAPSGIWMTGLLPAAMM